MQSSSKLVKTDFDIWQNYQISIVIPLPWIIYSYQKYINAKKMHNRLSEVLITVSS